MNEFFDNFAVSFPALVLGGAAKLENLQKVKVIEYLDPKELDF
ncbi:DUF1851 domain-containing protein [Shewanella sp. VB17]|nr:T6SS immunity protein Tdi1 domain-containing protein [Shewanella sp. VB17]NRD74009.1 DUF1851 domain-containing protein [Shewanella sp. VB17]